MKGYNNTIGWVFYGTNMSSYKYKPVNIMLTFMGCSSNNLRIQDVTNTVDLKSF